MNAPDRTETLPIIGMSPGNSYFKDAEARFLLEKTVSLFGRTAILVADIPAIATYRALGYDATKARAKAVLKGNNLKNRTRKMQKLLGLADDQVRIIEWSRDVDTSPEYQEAFRRVETLYRDSPAFTESVDLTTRAVLENSEKTPVDLEKATKEATFYLLSELAFLEFAPRLLDSQSVVYVYHKNWSVYEDYVAGRFDGKPKAHLDFLLLENPRETYKPLKPTEQEALAIQEGTLQRVLRTGLLRGAFSNYPPAFMVTEGGYSGIFYELIEGFARNLGVRLELTEETGYGVIVDGLNAGRFDIFCSAVWPTPERLAQAEFSLPLYMSEVFMWARPDDAQAASREATDSPFFRIAVKENDISDSIARADYANARRVRVPQLSDTTRLLEFVSQGKADATFAEPYLVERYNQTTKTRLVAVGKAVREYPNTFMFRSGEADFKRSLDEYVRVAIDSGLLDRLLDKYVGSGHKFKAVNRLGR